jgi:hypothetical protein
MDRYSDRYDAATYADALFGTGYPDTAPAVLRWVIEKLAAPLGDPADLGRNPVVIFHGDHHRLLCDEVWGRELLPFDVFYETVPKFQLGSFQWSVSDHVRSFEANDLAEACITPPGRGRYERVVCRYVDWSTCDPLTQDVYDALRRDGVPPENARVLAAGSRVPVAFRSPASQKA